jgi:uncharacterized membrane protein YphA (DoxX/SURF4 family)
MQHNHFHHRLKPSTVSGTPSSWAALMLYLVGRGAGPLSLDQAAGIK